MPRLLWTQKQNVGPLARVGHAMVYDTDRNRTVLFGGDSLRSQLFNDTWEWEGAHWTQMADIGPAPRVDQAMAYDGARRHTLMFGGSGSGGALRDTWAWNGEDWTQMADTGPANRTGHAVAYDSDRSSVVLFGGQSQTSDPLNDTWEWDGVDWTQVQDTGPSPRRAHVMTYDSVRRRVVLFGGTGADGLGQGDTWEWDGRVWTRVADFGATPCLSAAMTFKGDAIALFGGIGSINPSPAPTVFATTWQWDGSHWSLMQDIGPGPRWRHAMTYDAKRSHMVLFGGLPLFAPQDPNLADRVLGDTWEHTDQAPPVTIQSFGISPPSVGVADTATGTITLSGPAPAGGIAVQLTTQPPDPSIFFDTGPQVTIPVGSNTVTFRVGNDAPRTAPFLVTVVATLGASSTSATVTFVP